jgi:serine protease
MRSIAALASVIATTVVGIASPAEGAEASSIVPNRYIVVFKDSVANPALEAAEIVRRNGGTLHFTYTKAVRGFAATLPAAAVKGLARNPKIAFIEQDRAVKAGATQSPATWGLDRVDQPSLPLSGSYEYDSGASGVYAFVIDTGIRTTHTLFGGRVQAGLGYTAINDGRGTTDCNGHGTHVAGTIGSSTYGVAKGVTLVPIRVLDCNGSGTTSGVIAGVDFVAKSSARPAIGNMSLGGGYSSTLNSAVAKVVDAGVTMIVAAGNESTDACGRSPASEPKAITVASTTSSDARSSFSNYGSCVDIFAPGSSITSTWYSSDTSTSTISGTSMASPHVAGAAALALAADASASPAQVTGAILNTATTGKVTSAGTGSPNLLLYTLSLGGSGGTTNTPPVATFTSACTDATCSFDASASSDSDGSIGSHAWTFHDGTTASGVTTSKTYASSGTYSVTLTATDNLGATGTQTQSVSVTVLTSSPTLTGSAAKKGANWTATIRLKGVAGNATRGYWSTSPSTTVGCSIPSGSTTCSFSLSKIPGSVASVSYTESSGNSSPSQVTISRP